MAGLLRFLWLVSIILSHAALATAGSTTSSGSTSSPSGTTSPRGTIGTSEDAATEQVFVLTFGPGDHPFSKFGHNAVLVVDPVARTDRVYNFGTFSAHSPTLLQDFMQGRLMYWVSASHMTTTLAAYKRDNRSVVAQELRLSRQETRALVARLAESVLPQNRYYRYHYYLDNCSTKVRDILDEVLGGRLGKAKHEPNRLNWREHTSRLTAESLGLNLGLNLLLAGQVDTTRTRWEEMFLPSVLEDELRHVTKSDGTPLLGRELELYRAHRPALASSSPQRAPWMLLVGALFGGGLALLAQRRAKPVVRHVFALALLLIGTVAGFLGSVFCFFWWFTDHTIAHANENLFLFPPWALLLPVLGFAALLRGSVWDVRLRNFCLLLAAGSVCGLLAKALPGFDQDNWMFISLAVPMWGSLGAALHRSVQRQRAEPGTLGETSGARVRAPASRRHSSSPAG